MRKHVSAALPLVYGFHSTNLRRVETNDSISQRGAQLKMKARALQGSIALHPVIKTNVMKEHAHSFLPKIPQNNKKGVLVA